MLGAVVALAVGMYATVDQAGSPSPVPTPVPDGIHATFVSVAERRNGAVVTFVHDGVETKMPLAPDAVIRERAVGANWKTVEPTDLGPGAPLVVFVHGGSIYQIDALYAQVATRFILVKNGFGVAPSGKIYRLVGRAEATGMTLPQGAYVLLRVDPGSDTAFDLIASKTAFVDAVANAAKVVVTLEVLVPVNTPPADVVYVSTDALSWTPNAIRMSPLPGNRWTVTLSLTGGTLLKYKYTRGSWVTDERNQAGNEIANRTLTVSQKGPAQTVNDVVARWADRSS